MGKQFLKCTARDIEKKKAYQIHCTHLHSPIHVLDVRIVLLPLCLSLSASLCASLSLSLWVPLCLTVFVCLSGCLSVSVFVPFAVYVCMCAHMNARHCAQMEVSLKCHEFISFCPHAHGF